MGLNLTVYSPERKLIESKPILEITLNSAIGQIQILPGHAHLIGALVSGPFSYTSPEGNKVSGFISSGYFETKNEEIKVLAEVLELSSEIDLDRAKRAQKKAEAELQDPSIEEHRFKKYQLKLERALIRQQIAGKTVH